MYTRAFKKRYGSVVAGLSLKSKWVSIFLVYQFLQRTTYYALTMVAIKGEGIKVNVAMNFHVLYCIFYFMLKPHPERSL